MNRHFFAVARVDATPARTWSNFEDAEVLDPDRASGAEGALDGSENRIDDLGGLALGQPTVAAIHLIGEVRLRVVLLDLLGKLLIFGRSTEGRQVARRSVHAPDEGGRDQRSDLLLA